MAGGIFGVYKGTTSGIEKVAGKGIPDFLDGINGILKSSLFPIVLLIVGAAVIIVVIKTMV